MGHPTYEVSAQDGQTVHKSESDWQAPQLAKALLGGDGKRIDAFKTQLEKDGKRVSLDDFDGQLTLLFGHIQDRLKLGLGEPWLSKDGYDYRPSEGGGVPYESALDSTKFFDEPEEQWARALDEQFAFCMYHSPGQAYGTTDMAFYEKFPDMTPIAVACQNLSTYGVLSRGIPLSEVSTNWSGGCSCSGGTTGYPAFDKARVQKKPMAAPSSVTVDPKASLADRTQQGKDKQADLKQLGLDRKNLKAPDWGTVAKLVALPITPGSIIVYNAGGFEYNAQDVNFPGTGVVGAHTASVLRVSGSRIQFIDTGVVTGGGEGKAGEGGTSDHSFLTDADGLPSATSLVAVGVLRDSADKLAEFAKKTAAARPLGLTRLVIMRTASHEVVFASKLLNMRWPVARLVWSLRYLPVDGLTVMWLVYTTGDKASTEALFANATGAPASYLPSAPATATAAATPTLKLANILVSNGDAVNVYRSHTFSSFRLNFSGTDLAESAIDAFAYTLDDSTKLLEWCSDKDQKFGSLGKRFIRKTTGQKGVIEDAATGHALVDP